MNIKKNEKNDTIILTTQECLESNKKLLAIIKMLGAENIGKTVVKKEGETIITCQIVGIEKSV